MDGASVVGNGLVKGTKAVIGAPVKLAKAVGSGIKSAGTGAISAFKNAFTGEKDPASKVMDILSGKNRSGNLAQDAADAVVSATLAPLNFVTSGLRNALGFVSKSMGDMKKVQKDVDDAADVFAPNVNGDNYFKSNSKTNTFSGLVSNMMFSVLRGTMSPLFFLKAGLSGDKNRTSIFGKLKNAGNWLLDKLGFGKKNDTNATSLETNGAGDGTTTISNSDMMNNFPYLSQSDSRWGNIPYTVNPGSGQTISSSGCGTTSMAMILRSFGNNVTPVDTSKWSVDHGYRTTNSGTSWGFFNALGKEYNLNTKELPVSSESVATSLSEGKPLIASMKKGHFTKNGHFIVLSGADSEGNIMVNDPAGAEGMKRSGIRWPLGTILNEAKRFWSFDKSGKGSIGNIVPAGQIASTADSVVDDTAISKNTIASNTPTDDIASTGIGSIAEFLTGYASAFMKPLLSKLGFSNDDVNTIETATDNTNSDTTSSKISNIDMTGNTNAEKVWSFLKSQGYSDAAAAGVLGNMQQESGVDPTKLQDGVGPAAGIVQWENYNTKSKRWANMAAYAKSKGKDWTDLQSQLEFMIMELNGDADKYTNSLFAKKGYGSYEDFTKMTDPKLATKAFENVFERAGNPELEKRYEYATNFYNAFKDKPSSTPNKAGTTVSEANGAGINVELPTASGTTPGTGTVFKSYVNPKYDSSTTSDFGGSWDTISVTRVIALLERIANDMTSTSEGIDSLNSKDFTSSSYNNNSKLTTNHNTVNAADKSANTPVSGKDRSGYALAKQLAKGTFAFS